MPCVHYCLLLADITVTLLNVCFLGVKRIPEADILAAPQSHRGRPSLSDGIHTGPRVLAVTISVNRRSCVSAQQLECICAQLPRPCTRHQKILPARSEHFETHTDSGCCAASEFYPGSAPAKQRWHKKEWNTSAMWCRACRLPNARALNVNVIMSRLEQRSSSEGM